MAFDPQRHHRRSIRLADYDYRQNGAYYVTICTHDRECLLGEIDGDGRMRRNDYGEDRAGGMGTNGPGAGQCAFGCLRGDAQSYAWHFGHRGYGWYGRPGGSPVQRISGPPVQRINGSPEQWPECRIIRRNYRAVQIHCQQAHQYLARNAGMDVWHRNYYERIIRNEEMLEKARRYIANNPAQWAEDVNNPAMW